VSNLLVRLESGLRVSDSQCGFRVYPLALLDVARCTAGRYGLETEVLTRAAWASCDVIEVPVTCRYAHASAHEHVSHFRPWVDSFRAVPMHARLVARAMLPVPHQTWGRSQTSATTPVQSSHVLAKLLDWINPARLVRDVREERLGPHETATALAVGVFIGNLPLFGAQTILSLYTARRLHLHPLAVVAGSHVSTPPFGPVLIATAVGVGHWLLHGSWLRLPIWQATWREWGRLMGNLLLEWSLGSLLVGFTLAVVAFFVSRVLLSYVAVARGGAGD
jgi:uncharacterized protein (DUF2062 family)